MTHTYYRLILGLHIKMPDANKILLIDEPLDRSALVQDAYFDIESAGFRCQTATLEHGLSILDQRQVAAVLCEFSAHDKSSSVLHRVLEHAGSIPVLTYGPDHAAVDAIVAGSEEHVTTSRLTSSSLATILQIAVERRRRLLATESNEARLCTLIQASSDCLVIVDEAGTVRFANRAAEKLFDCGNNGLVGQVLGTPSGDAEVAELSIVRPGTNDLIAAEMRVARVEWDGKPAYIESIRDVTQQKQEAQKARDAIRMRDHFLATLSHELRNPLAALNNAAQVLALEHGQSPSLKHPVEIIQRQCHQMVRLLDDLLDISRISQGKVELRREFVSFSQLVLDCLQVMRPRIEHSHRLQVELPSETLYLYADPSRIQQILVNLLTNAVKYTSHGGEIRVRAVREGNEAVLTISDQGHGISAELLDSIFEPFVQAEQTLARSDGGLGIGLAVVRRLVELHGGTVTATSLGLGHGSQFTMRLPLCNPVSKPPVGELPACPHRLRICVIDDVKDAAEMMSKLLETLGHEVIAAYDGEQGLELILAAPPDVVFLDIGLPGMNGYEVAETIVQNLPNQPIKLVALTGYGQPEDRQRALNAGFHDHLVKPVSFANLQTCLGNIVSNKKIAEIKD